MKSFKERCVELRKQDYSLLEIAKITGRPKTSVYFHVRSMSLSPARLAKTHALNLEHLAKIADKRRGISSKGFKEFDSWTPSLITLVAHLIFDGEITKSRCVYNNRNKALLDNVEHCMREVYEFSPNYYLNKLTGVSRISYFNVALSAYIKMRSIDLLKEIVCLPKNLKQEFLRAFFNDEGCMDFRPLRNLRRIRGYQKNTEILALVRTLLADLDIDAFIQKPNEVVIIGKKNLVKFQKEIGFSPGVYINGNRTNSLWKKHLEKRQLLEMAIASYKKS